jgi:hypothetical protein
MPDEVRGNCLYVPVAHPASSPRGHFAARLEVLGLTLGFCCSQVAKAKKKKVAKKDKVAIHLGYCRYDVGECPAPRPAPSPRFCFLA